MFRVWYVYLLSALVSSCCLFVYRYLMSVSVYVCVILFRWRLSCRVVVYNCLFPAGVLLWCVRVSLCVCLFVFVVAACFVLFCIALCFADCVCHMLLDSVALGVCWFCFLVCVAILCRVLACCYYLCLVDVAWFLMASLRCCFVCVVICQFIMCNVAVGAVACYLRVLFVCLKNCCVLPLACCCISSRLRVAYSFADVCDCLVPWFVYFGVLCC